MPQVLPVLISQVLYYFESNTRSATIIGIVGAGGIGLHLAEMIRTYEWDRVAFIILMVLVTVGLIDFDLVAAAAGDHRTKRTASDRAIDAGDDARHPAVMQAA